MSEDCNQQAERKIRGFFEDNEGDKSSGRLIKIFSFFMAIVFAIAGVFLLYAARDSGIAAEMGKYMVSIVAMFLGVATSAEFIQKVTKT